MTAPSPSFAILVGSLEPSGELASVIELLTWQRTARPDLHAIVIARTGGAWHDRVAAVAQVERLDAQTASKGARLLQRAHLEPVARRVRGAASRQLLRLGKLPVVVEASGEPSRPWLDPEAAPVLTHHHRSLGGDPATNDVLIDLWPQGDRRDDEPGLVERWLATQPEAPARVAIMGPEHNVVPDDVLLATIWAVVDRAPGTRFTWTTPPLAEAARAAVEAQLRDSGLSSLVEVIDDPEVAWRAVAASDAVLALRGEDCLGLAPDRVVEAAATDPADALAAQLAEVLDREVGAPRTDPADLAAVSGPRWLEALGLG